MKLIVQKIDGEAFVFVENEKMFKCNEKNRGLKLDNTLLNEECSLDFYPENFHMVFDLQR